MTVGPVARWNSRGQVWETQDGVPHTESWPAEGVTRKGSLFPLPRRRSAPPAGLFPTPRATDGTKGGPNQRGSKGDLMLPSAVVRMVGENPTIVL